MNKEIPFVDLADTTCWMIYLMPFGSEERTDYKKVYDFQKSCIENKIFGMGWCPWVLKNTIVYGTAITPEYVETHFKLLKILYKEKGWGDVEQGALDALNQYNNIRKGDYVMTQIKNGHYYIGRVSSDVIYVYNEQENAPNGFLSWGAMVEEWIEFQNDSELPSELVGRFSSRYHKTIERNNWYRQNMLIISAYEGRAEKKNPLFYDMPKLIINKNNFVRSCNYKELEDLVSVFIADKHKNNGYYLLPSSCKISEHNYEFRFESKFGKPITCQVKNQSEDIRLEEYVFESSYEKIYIFCGKWNDNDVENYNAEYNKRNPAIYIIKPEELFKMADYINMFNSSLYNTDFNGLRDMSTFKLDNFTKINKRFGKFNPRAYKESIGFLSFIKDGCLFYSEEFDALILKYHFMENREQEKGYIDDILKALNQ